jgi:predicted alpha/beta hydrolase family esterase
MKVIIVHGCPSNIERAQEEKTRTYDKHWIPWLKQSLSEKNIQALVPLMPKPWYPNYKSWKKEFDKLDIDKEDVLIGHSCGCAFLVRWLGETKNSVKKLILVAPWKIPEYDREKEFYNYEINPDIQKYFDKSITFTANDEYPDGKKSVRIFNEVLNGEIIELKYHGHYTLGDMHTEEFPELLEKVLE